MKVRLLGPIQVLANGESIDLPVGRQRTLLAALGLARGRALTIEAIAERLWADDPPSNLRGGVATCVMRLRTTLGKDAVERTAHGYRLAVEPGNVDVVEFRSLVSGASDASGPADEVERLRRALDLWDGEPLAGVASTPLLDIEAAALTEERLATYARLVELELELGNQEKVIPQLTEVVAQNPLREQFARQLMLALYRADRQVDALDVYRRLRTMLAEELGLDPGPDLTALRDQILQGAVATVSTVDVAPEIQVPHQLPADPPQFVGRLREMSQLEAVTENHTTGTAQVILLVGPAGVGKTSLALRWAHRHHGAFPGGQLFLNLNGYGVGEPMRPDRALAALLESMQVPQSQIPTDPQARSALLRTLFADRKILVVLDNVQNSEQIRPLLPGLSSTVIVTSRNQLRGLVAREHATRVVVPTLDADDGVSLLARLGGESRIADEHDAAATIVELCDRLPLAICIAGERIARTAGASVAELVTELAGDDLALLDSDEEATGLSSVLSWSHDELDERARRVFRLLGLHSARQFSLDSVAALTGLSTKLARSAMDQLVAVHLAQHVSNSRYEMHDLVQTYARSHAYEIESDVERTAAVRRMLGWYLHTALNARRAMHLRPIPTNVLNQTPPPDALTFDTEEAAMRWCAAERVNLVDIPRYTIDAGLPDFAFEFAMTLWTYLYSAGHREDIELMHRIALPWTRQRGNREREAVLLSGLSAALQVTDPKQAVSYICEALEIYRELGHARGEATALGNLGLYYLHPEFGRAAEAAECLEAAIRIRQDLDLPDSQASSLNNLAMARLQLGQYPEALASASRALELFQQLGDAAAQGSTLDTLGRIHLVAGRPKDAADCLSRAIEIARSFGNRPSEARWLIALGRAYAEQGDLAAAHSAWAQSARSFEALGQREMAAESRSLIAGDASARVDIGT